MKKAIAFLIVLAACHGHKSDAEQKLADIERKINQLDTTIKEWQQIGGDETMPEAQRQRALDSTDVWLRQYDSLRALHNSLQNEVNPPR
jgi:hypothetical protein